tara:strand:+ start:82 stop:432 length:351 start_codon:yes stop_codon:yes gene_type:complete
MKLLLENWRKFAEGAGDYLEPDWKKTPDQSPEMAELVDDEDVRQMTRGHLDDEGARDAASAVPLSQIGLPLSDEQERHYDHMDQQDRNEILQQIINDLVDEGLVGKVGDSLYYSIG